jgi:hypothetical protein
MLSSASRCHWRSLASGEASVLCELWSFTGSGASTITSVSSELFSGRVTL